MTMADAPVRTGMRLLAALMACALLLPAARAAAQHPVAASRIAATGFGDQRNSYAWSMAWFKGKLYVGTARQMLCVENATIDFYYPGLGMYGTNPTSGVFCPPSPYDMDLRGEIWEYTPGTRTWRRVFQSPADIPNPRAPGKLVARDIGFRGMVVYRGRLYVGGVTANEYIPELVDRYPPRILSTTDGRRWTPIRSSPRSINTFKGAQKPIGFRAMAVYRDRLYVTASAGLTGDGVVLRVNDPDGRRPMFRQISPPGLQVFEMQTYNDHLYLGTGSDQTGYGVYRTKADRGASSRVVPIVTGGAGRGRQITSVVAMGVYRNRLYVGASGWYTGALLPESELIRINDRDRWELVAGATRVTDDGRKSPISGLSDGFGNIFNTHFWRMQVIGGALMVGTNDSSWALRDVPIIGDTLRSEFGFDVYGTCDGRFWWPVTKDAFGDGRFNFGARTMEVNSRGRGFIGSANHVQGAAVFRTGVAPLCAQTANGARATAAATLDRGPSPVARPARALADRHRCGTVVSWDRSPGAVRYRVLRADERRLRNVPLPERRVLPGGEVPDDPLSGPRTRRGDLTVPGPWRGIGTTNRSWLVDRRGGAARYQVIAVPRRGPASAPSNTAVAGPTGRAARAEGNGGGSPAAMASLARERRARYAEAACRR